MRVEPFRHAQTVAVRQFSRDDAEFLKTLHIVFEPEA
jgi:hypothetical protein